MNAASAEMLPSGWVHPGPRAREEVVPVEVRAGSVGSSRSLFSGWYQPAFQNRFFSTWSEVKKPSIPPEFAVISTVIFWRAWISGRVSHFTFMPESDSNSGMCFSSTSMNGCLVRSRKSSLPAKRFQLKPCARAGVETNGPAAAPAAKVPQKGAAGQATSSHRSASLHGRERSTCVVIEPSSLANTITRRPVSWYTVPRPRVRAVGGIAPDW